MSPPPPNVAREGRSTDAVWRAEVVAALMVLGTAIKAVTKGTASSFAAAGELEVPPPTRNVS